jgi:hypothetical protein
VASDSVSDIAGDCDLNDDADGDPLGPGANVSPQRRDQGQQGRTAGEKPAFEDKFCMKPVWSAFAARNRFRNRVPSDTPTANDVSRPEK